MKRQTEITNIMHQVGIPAHILGYYYIRDAITMVVDDPSDIHHMTKYLYPSVAKNHNTTPSRVERAIRHAIEVSCYRGDADFIKKMFGYTIDTEIRRPTNGEFIGMIADVIRLKEAESESPFTTSDI